MFPLLNSKKRVAIAILVLSMGSCVPAADVYAYRYYVPTRYVPMGSREYFNQVPSSLYAPTIASSLIDEAMSVMNYARPYRHNTLASEAQALRNAFVRRDRAMQSARLADAFFHDFDEMFQELSSFARAALPATPSLEVRRSEDDMGFEVYASGLKPDSVHVNVDDDTLKIDATSADGQVKLTRTLRLPRSVADASKITAEATDGVLKLMIPDAAMVSEPEPVKAAINVRNLAYAASHATGEEKVSTAAETPSAVETTPPAEVDGMTVQDAPDDEDESDI